MKKILTVLMAIVVTTTLSSCAAFGAFGESLNRAYRPSSKASSASVGW